MPRNQPTSPSPPPPTSFPFTSGGHDFPQASASPLPASRPRASASRIDQLSQFLGRRRQDREQWTDGAAQRRSGTDPASRRQAGRAIPRHAERESGTGSLSSGSTSGLALPRPWAVPGERYLRRGHARSREQRSSDIDPTDILESLSDIPLNQFRDPGLTRRERSPAGDLDGQRRQSKRRKLDHNTSQAPEYDGFKYGYKGQVVSGRLRMEVFSCDGGEYERYNSERLYRVQNVLKNDNSVYCSESSRCNLLLKHIGEVPFTLEKIVIRAPDRGFTAPVQEGLIFVSMSPHNLITGTSAYHIQYSHSPPPQSPTPSSQSQLLSLQEALDDESLWDHNRQAMEERIERLRLRNRRLLNQRRSRAEHQEEDRPSANDEDDDTAAEYCPYHMDEGETAAAGVSAPTPPPFTVTTDSEQEESDQNEPQPSAAVMADRLRRESRWRPESDEDEDPDEDNLLYRYPLGRARPLDMMDTRDDRWNPMRTRSIRAARLHAPSRIEAGTAGYDTDGLIAPHARFFIARNKNKISIKFHPAISGKYVLLKLWSPTNDGNIDIESVQFYGYSGPRFFPAVEPR